MLDQQEKIHAIKEGSNAWIPGTHRLSQLTLEEKKQMLGLIKSDPSQVPMETCFKPEIIRANPATFDWRKATLYNITGNWITPVRDQANCGACVSFAITAMMEAMWKIIVAKTPSKTIDKSEWDIFLRGGGSCQNGSQFERILAAAQAGQCDETCFPYLTSDPRCPDYKNQLLFLKDYNKMGSADSMKAWISTVGPLIIGINVPSDMFDYSGGIYHWDYGDIVGGHGVCVVGYNDTERYWIIKNSWGTEFGESGYIRIDYDTATEIGMLVDYPVYGGNLVIPGPVELVCAITPKPANMQVGGQVQLNGNPAGGKPPYTHNWQGNIKWLNDNAIQSPVFSGAPTGKYQLDYTVVDSDNASASDTVDINVSDIPPATPDITLTKKGGIVYVKEVFMNAKTVADLLINGKNYGTLRKLNKWTFSPGTFKVGDTLSFQLLTPGGLVHSIRVDDMSWAGMWYVLLSTTDVNKQIDAILYVNLGKTKEDMDTEDALIAANDMLDKLIENSMYVGALKESMLRNVATLMEVKE